MGVSTVISVSGPYVADGINRFWDFDFKTILLSHLQLLVTDNSGVVTTVTGSFAATGLGAGAGGTVEYPISPADSLPSGYKVVVQRLVPFTQDTILGNQGAYFPQIHETRFDLLTMEIQQINDKIGNALFVPLAEGLGSFPLPDLATRAGKVLGFDAITGLPVALVSPGLLAVTSFIETLLDDNDAATARATLGAGVAGGFGVKSAIVSAATTDLGTLPSHFALISGGVNITSFGSSANVNSPIYIAKVSANTQIGPSANIFFINGSTQINMLAGDVLILEYLGGGQWDVLDHSLNGTRRQSIWVPATAMNAPAASSGFISLAGAGFLPYLAFDPVSIEAAFWSVAMPKSWNQGVLAAKIYWAHPATTVNFGTAWLVECAAFGDNEMLNVDQYTGNGTTDTGGVTSNLYMSTEIGAIEPGGTQGEGDLTHFRVLRDPTNGGDTLAVDAFLIGIMIYYDTTAETDN